MARGVCLTFVVLTVLVLQTRAVSFVNNATVPSDILSKIFLDKIRNDPNLLNISVESSKTYDPLKCVLGLQEIVNRFPSLDVLPFLDAWGSIPSGILYGHLQHLGNFDQCVKTSVVLSEATGLVNGQYCFASIPLMSEQVLDVPPVGLDARADGMALADLIQISIAICVPDSCDPRVLNAIFQQAADSIFNGALSGINVNRCQTAKKPDFEAINIVGIVIFSIIGALMALSTAYDLLMYYLEKPAVPILLAFSVLSNGRKLFAINTTKSPNSIDCLSGIRVLSMIWVVYCHNYVFSILLPLINYIDIIPWVKAASSMHVMNATVSVDTFLFMSGLLVAWLGFRELEKNKGRINVFLMYFHRYIRLTPPVAAVVLFLLSIDSYIGTGPIRRYFDILNEGCKTKWWATLLYVQNYAADNVCVSQSWYLAVDTQLYVLSPLILIPLWKWGRKFAPVMFILSILSIGCVIATYFTEGYTSFTGLIGDNQNFLTYMPTHTRYSVWLVGVGLGYFMYKNKHKSMRPSKFVQLLGWIVCFVTILAIIYGPYFTINADRSTTVLEAAMYESLKRVSWAIALSWIVFACHFGFGGIINSFLSHPCWQPVARLTFSLYLVHMAVQNINYGITRTDVHFSDYTEILFTWSTFGISLMAAIVLTLAFESPVLVIEKILLSGGKKKDTQNTNGTNGISHKSA